ncbi:MAG TPA: TetR/AcrR family transcriptional regulator [Candidatus Anoxymicrobiaceae bacterium]
MIKTDTKTRKDRSRDKIVESAGCLMREKGIAATSVADVMDGAGMTVGGFYAHFHSKQDLVAETLASTIGQSRKNLKEAARGKHGAAAVREMARSYLSRSHRDNPESGCPLPATAGELAGADSALRQVLADELDASIRDITAYLAEDGVEIARGEAIADLALMAGGLTLARAVKGTDLSDEILKACREHIKRSLPD